jgi:hypothetical protein
MQGRTADGETKFVQLTPSGAVKTHLVDADGNPTQLGGGTSTPTTQTATVFVGTFTSAAGLQYLQIPAGALEVSLANTGSQNATITTPSMAPDEANIKPVTNIDGSVLNLRAPQGYKLEAMTIMAPVGVTVDYAIIR